MPTPLLSGYLAVPNRTVCDSRQTWGSNYYCLKKQRQIFSRATSTSHQLYGVFCIWQSSPKSKHSSNISFLIWYQLLTIMNWYQPLTIMNWYQPLTIMNWYQLLTIMNWYQLLTIINWFLHLRPWQDHNRPTTLYILFYLFSVSVYIPLSLSPSFLFPSVPPFNCNHPQSFIQSLFQLLISKLTQFLRLQIFELLIFLYLLFSISLLHRHSSVISLIFQPPSILSLNQSSPHSFLLHSIPHCVPHCPPPDSLSY